jgi:hypothetical protein
MVITASPVFEAYQQLELQIPDFPAKEVRACLVAFSLGAIDRARLRIDLIHLLSTEKVRGLFLALCRAYLVKCMSPDGVLCR